MFQLITATLAGVLAALMAGWTFYYGGSAFHRSSAEAYAEALSTAGNQIAAAVQVYRVDHAGRDPSSIADLVPAYLTSNPVPPQGAQPGASWELSFGPGASWARIRLTDGSAGAICAQTATIANGALPSASFGCEGSFFAFRL